MQRGLTNAEGDATGNHGFGDLPGARFLESSELCAEARRRTGLHDFGEPAVEPPLKELVTSLEREASLHALGRFLMRAHLRGLLEARLKLAKQWRESAEPPPIASPVFITGMPRSGSTFLHELLAQDPALRAPRVWEVMFPDSARSPDRGWRDGRVWRTALCLWWFRRLAPAADSVYPIRARTPHECLAIQSHTFLSEEFVSTCHVPSYEAFLRTADLRPAYRWEKRFLQHLQAGARAPRWLLKSPDHASGLDALFSAFPDAFIVQTHRHPLDSLRSLIHLNEVLQGLYGKPLSREQLAEREARNLGASMERLFKFRDEHPELSARFIDVNYSDLVADPLRILRQIFQRLGACPSEGTLARVRQLALSRSAYKGRKTAPALAEVARATRAQIRLFNEYCRRFGLLSALSGSNPERR